MQYIQVSFGKRKSKDPLKKINSFDTTLYDYICERNGIAVGDMVVVECEYGKFFDRFQDEGVSVAFVVKTNVPESSLSCNVNELKRVICKVENNDIIDYELSKVKGRSIAEYKEYTFENLLKKVENMKQCRKSKGEIITAFENQKKVFEKEIEKYTEENKRINSYEVLQKIIAARRAAMQVFCVMQSVKAEVA